MNCYGYVWESMINSNQNLGEQKDRSLTKLTIEANVKSETYVRVCNNYKNNAFAGSTKELNPWLKHYLWLMIVKVVLWTFFCIISWKLKVQVYD